MISPRFITPLIILVGTMIASTGCSNVDQATRKRESSNIKLLAVAFASFTGKHARAPKDEEEFREFLDAKPTFWKNEQIGSVERLLVSDRDGKPFVVMYGADITTDEIVIHEQVGDGNVVFAANAQGGVRELTADEIRQNVKGAG